jgi:Flp pilus assembly protein TadD
VEAEEAYREAIARLEKLTGEYPDEPEYRSELARSHNDLGILLKDLGKPAEAEAAYGQALALRQKLASDFPAVPRYRQDLAGSYVNHGNRCVIGTNPRLP